jgi:spore cortex formation protein SpoVR/YcgB (stage V sporulation)
MHFCGIYFSTGNLKSLETSLENWRKTIVKSAYEKINYFAPQEMTGHLKSSTSRNPLNL